MPTYTYRCTKCGEEIEVVQSMTDSPLKRCKKCRGALRRTYQSVGIVLKGPGFHRTDYRSKPASDAKKDASESSDKKKETPKTESKPSDAGSASKSDT